MNNEASKLVELIRDITRSEIEKTDQTVKCIVDSVNIDGTLNIHLITDVLQNQNTLIRNITNMSRYNFVSGDIAILYKIQNNINNAFIIGRFGRGEDAIKSLSDNLYAVLSTNTGTASITIGGSGGGGGSSQTFTTVEKFGDLLDISAPSQSTIYFVKDTETIYLYEVKTNKFESYTPYGVQGLVMIDGGVSGTTDYTSTNYDNGFGSVKKVKV